MINLADCPTLHSSDANLSATTWLKLAPLWLAQFLADSPLRNAVIDKLLRCMVQGELACIFGPQSVNLAWENTAPGSTVRRLMLCVLNAYYQPKYVRERWEEFDEEVVEELRRGYERDLRCMRDERKGVVRWEYVVPNLAAKGKCVYHEHDGRFSKCGSQ